MIPISFKRHRFLSEIIQHAVWLHARFTLSFRDVEDLLAERGIDVSNETVRRWFLKFRRLIAGNLHRSRPRASARWNLDEMVIKIRGQKALVVARGRRRGGGSRPLGPASTLCQIGETIAPKAAQETGLCADAHNHGQTQILRRRHS